MKINSRHICFLFVGVVALILAACSTQKNTSGSRFWHSFTAKYNTYYNGTLAYIDGSLEKENGNKDNFTEMLPLYYVGNKSSVELGSGNFDKAIEKCEKAIKLHSIKKKPEWTKSRRKTDKDREWLGRKEYNPMLWKAWLLMGRSQFHKGDFSGAAATFSYMGRLYQTQPAIYAKSRAWLAKCYIEEGWMYDAEDVIRNISRDSIHWSARKEWNYTYANYYIHAKEYAKAIPYLQQVIKKEGRKKQKARELFLLGQLYAALGNNINAYKAYKRVIRQNPPYELEFNARIAMTEVAGHGQAKNMISKLRSMARNDNNKQYLDQVYYAMGNIYMAQKDTINAITAYERGNRESTRNGIEKGVLLLRLGDIYWDMEKYSDAGRCYGEAIGLLDKDRPDYEQLADRSKKLDELTPYTDAIHLQDSLQALALMSDKDRNAAIDRVIAELKRKEKAERDALAEQNAEEVMNRNAQSTSNRTNTSMQTTMQQNNGLWYFYNQMIVNQGKQSFQKIWGKRNNADHWNRSNKTVVDFGDSNVSESNLREVQSDSVSMNGAENMMPETEENVAANDPHNREFYMLQIPFTPEQKQASDLIIMDGLYNSGVIFKDKLDNLRLSEKQFNRLLTQYSAFENKADVYYHMFLLYSRLEEHNIADSYLMRLKTEFPENQWTTLLTDPHFVENQRFGIHIEDSLYAATYTAFKADRYNEIRLNVKLSKDRFPLGANRDKFIFIDGLAKLNSGNIEGCLEDMNTVVKNYSQSKLAELAGMIVNGVKQGRRLHGGKFDMGDVWARRSAVLSDSDSINARQFTDDPNIDFVFMIAYQPDSVNGNQLLYELARYNFTSFMVRNFDIELEDQNGLHVLKIGGFRNYQEALEYAHQFYRQPDIIEKLGKSRTYVISEQNRALLGVNYSYEDYEKYYSEHFLPLPTDNKKRLFEPAGDERYLDDGGSIPGNISPILKKQQADQDSIPVLPVDDGTVILPVEPAGKPVDDGTIIIEGDKVESNIPKTDEPIIIEEGEEEGTEDETFEVEGF